MFEKINIWGLLGALSSFFSKDLPEHLILTLWGFTGFFSVVPKYILNRYEGLWPLLEPARPYFFIAFVGFCFVLIMRIMTSLSPRVTELFNRYWNQYQNWRERIRNLHQLSSTEKEILKEYIGEGGEEVNCFHSRNVVVNKLWEKKDILEIGASPPYKPELNCYMLKDWARDRLEENPDLIKQDDDLNDHN